MDLHVPEQKFTLTEGGFANLRVEVLPAVVVSDEPAPTPAPEPVVAETPVAPVEEPAPVTVEASEQPAQTTEAVTVTPVGDTLVQAGAPTV